jgi:predicted DNA-binding transcriptional regulator AlpA
MRRQSCYSPPHKKLLRIPEFLELYSISRTAFYREVSAGRLMLTKIGNASRVAAEDAEAWASALPKWDIAS